jgi:hypothetical protein
MAPAGHGRDDHGVDVEALMKGGVVTCKGREWKAEMGVRDWRHVAVVPRSDH